jgi:diguanylate cyclase (GGDEF)-like protein
VDIDRFKTVNDQHGHGIGDEVLLAVAEIIKKAVGKKGNAYRYGGEEIAILVTNYANEEGLALGERIREAVESAVVSGRRLKVTVSVGMATAPDSASNPSELFNRADAALYEAKELGRNYVRFFGEPKPSKPVPRTVARREPEARGLTEKQASEIRIGYFRTGRATCPHDGAQLDVQRSDTMGRKTPDLLVSCPVCGLLENLSGD